ncbi:MAG: hypothetical protein IJT25_03905 [Clostridia bacterium]|nr:hypothetical protein [Clostridia bacterium]
MFYILSIKKETTSVYSQSEFGSIIVSVLEKGSLAPIDNATVCVIETRQYYSTTNNGLTEKISVPIIENSTFSNSLKQNYGTITLLVYKLGYSSVISFYNIVKKNTTSVGNVVFLEPIINSIDNKTEIITNNPDSAWANELAKLYKK